MICAFRQFRVCNLISFEGVGLRQRPFFKKILYLSYADYALGMADLIESGAHIGERVSLVQA